MSTIVRQSVWSSAILLLLAPPTLAFAQRVYHEDFEKIKTSWTLEKSDASYMIVAETLLVQVHVENGCTYVPEKDSSLSIDIL